MKFTIKRKDVEGEQIEIERSPVSGRVKVSVGGKELERLKDKNRPFNLKMKDKTHKKMFIHARWLDPVPAVFIDSEEVLLAEKLRVIDYAFGSFPILMFLVYGPFSTVVAFFLLMGNFRILRTRMSPTVKWAAIYAMDIAVFWIVVTIIKLVLSASK